MNETASRTALYPLHEELGARFVTFAGYAMPVNYGTGILEEHRWCRASAALFDVSHMGQLVASGEDATAALESVTPADLAGLREGEARYCLLTNEIGGIRDDFIATRVEGGFHLVVNASTRAADVEYLQRGIGSRCHVRELRDRCLLALQGPRAAAVVGRLTGGASDALPFMRSAEARVGAVECRITRAGYTGEDGFEISVAQDAAIELARLLLAQPEVRPAGLGARDALRLEAGLCLYGHDLDETTTPVQADLAWTVARARRPGGARPGGYPGADAISRELAQGPARRRVGLAVEGRVPVREGAVLSERGGGQCGQVTSGGFSPTLNQPIAMGYIDARVLAAPGALVASARGREIAVTVAALPFVPHRYFRATAGTQ